MSTVHGNVRGVFSCKHSTVKEDAILKLTHDMKLLVAIGKSRMTKHWQNKGDPVERTAG